MYDDSGYFDPPPYDPNNPMTIPSSLVDTNNMINNNNNSGLEFSLEDLSGNLNNPSSEDAGATGLEQLHHQLGGLDLEHELHSHLMQDNDAPPIESANWDIPTALENIGEASIHHQYTEPLYGPSSAPDLLNLLQLPRCNMTPASIAFNGPNLRPAMSVWADDGSMLYDPSIHLGYPGPQPNVLRDLFHSLPQNYGLFSGVDQEREAGVFQETEGRQFDGSHVMDYRREMGGRLGKGALKGNFATERHRRQQLNGKYEALKSLVPNPTKNDRASIVGDATEYIKELLRTVDELKILIEKRRHGRGPERRRMLNAEDDAARIEHEREE